MSNNEKVDGMRYPSIDDLLKVIDSKYKLAYVAAKRGKIIQAEEWCSLDETGSSKSAKPIGKALEEVLAGDTTIKFKE